MLKNLKSLVPVVALLVLAVGSGTFCSGQDEPTSAEGEKIVWKFHTLIEERAPITQSMKKDLCDPVYEKTNGGLEIVMYPGGVLGSERDVMQSLQLGSVEVMLHTAGIVGIFLPEFNFLSLPFLFQDKAHLDRFAETNSWKNLTKKTENHGFYFIEIGALGFRMPNTCEKLIKNPSDFKGMKFRTMEVPLQIETIQALGGIATPLPWGEVYQSLKTRVVDGWFNDALAFRNLSTYEVAPYVTELPLFGSFACLSISKSAFDSLPKEYQKIVWEVFSKNAKKAINTGYEDNLDILAELEQTKFKDFHRITDLSAFRDSVSSIYDDFVNKIPESKSILDEVMSSK